MLSPNTVFGAFQLSFSVFCHLRFAFAIFNQKQFEVSGSRATFWPVTCHYNQLRHRRTLIIVSGSQDKTRLLLLGGLPIYQYDGDDGPDVCYCNIPGEWSSVNSSGAGAAFTVTYPA
jgi:hypothetical protein